MGQRALIIVKPTPIRIAREKYFPGKLARKIKI
jgi:hypothetical protein